MATPTLWRNLCIVGLAYLAWAQAAALTRADAVLDWNTSIRNVIQSDGQNAVNQANPGYSTRSMAMMNGALYDVAQAFNRTHNPFLVNTTAGVGVSRDAALHQAAHEVLMALYPGQSAILNNDYNSRIALVAPGGAKTAGMALGSQIAQAYLASRAGDGSNNNPTYMAGTDPGDWWPQAGQSAWGPGWGAVETFAIGSTQPYVDALPPVPALTSQEYTDAFNQVKAYGALNSAVRTTDQTDIGLFWGYDRPTMGPPPVLFNRNLSDVATQAGNTEDENARLFAMGSVAMADAAIAAWDAKFSYNFWRPIAALQGQRPDLTTGRDDGNPNTIEDPTWQPLGAPGSDPNSSTDDFTPPFPAWTSGHATMGAATFKTLQLFYGTNVWDEVDGILGNDLEYVLTSQEFANDGIAGMIRDYSTFTQTGPIDVGLENSPDGENATSRIYLGIHWIFDQRDGATLGYSIAEAVAGSRFGLVPEPSAVLLALFGAAAIGVRARRRN